MKRTIYTILLALSAAAMSLTGCSEKYITYDDKEYVMFADSIKTYAVRDDVMEFEVPVVSTVTKPYDRNFAVEILDTYSTAVEGRDFVLETNNFTIPAGERTGYVKVYGKHDRLDDRNDLSFRLRLIMPDRLVMPLYGNKTDVFMRKICSFKRENYTGWAVVTSMFLYEYSLTRSYQRLIYTSPDPENEYGVILHDFLADGYDISIAFDEYTDPVNPGITMKSGQIVSDEGTVFGMVHGDNHILIETSTQGPSYYFSCRNVALLVNRFYVENLGDEVGTVGHFMTEIDWISDEEADRLKREEGM